jgi:hypothetical protein
MDARTVIAVRDAQPLTRAEYDRTLDVRHVRRDGYAGGTGVIDTLAVFYCHYHVAEECFTIGRIHYVCDL